MAVLHGSYSGRVLSGGFMIPPASFNYYLEEMDNLNNVTGLLPLSEQVLQVAFGSLFSEEAVNDLLEGIEAEGCCY